MNTLTLMNCRLEPVGSYLKALGILRLVGEQLDPKARGWWKRDIFFLDSQLSEEELIAFFLEEYRPAPLVAPWNRGSGFYPGDQQAGIGAIESSSEERFTVYRRAISVAREITSSNHDTASKEDLIESCRSALPDEAVAWLDAAVVITGDGAAYPPILGTGGNVGRLDFSNNFMQRLAEVFALDGRANKETSKKWLETALFEDQTAPLSQGPIGQFSPGAAGGASSSPFDPPASISLVNPWEFVLLLEGALLFAGAAARRLGSEAFKSAAMPFMVSSTAVGYVGASASEKSRGELWAPVWSRPASHREVASLIGEGRAQWGRKQARSGLDFARAAATLGVDRGIDRFVRYSFVERFGQAMLAVPTGHLAVCDISEVRPLSQLDGWLTRVRRGKNPSAGIESRLRRVEVAEVELSRRGGAQRLQAVLIAAAELEEKVGRGQRFRDDAGIDPILGLSSSRWIGNMDDGTPEFRLAAALASQRDHDGSSLRSLLRPVVWTPSKRRWDWTDEAVVPGFGSKAFGSILAEALCRRAMTAGGRPPTSEDDDIGGVDLVFEYRLPALLTDVVAFLRREVDSARVQRLLSALMLLDWRDRVDVDWFTDAPSGASPPAGYCLLAPFFHGRDMDGGDTRVRLRAQPGWPRLLYSGRDVQVFGEAIRRLRFARLDPALALSKEALSAMAATGPSPRRLAAALFLPITDAAAANCLKRVVPKPVVMK